MRINTIVWILFAILFPQARGLPLQNSLAVKNFSIKPGFFSPVSRPGDPRKACY